MYQFLRKWVRSAEDAEELLQETWLRLLRHGDLNQLDTSGRSFLFTVATNLVRDRHRTHKARHYFQHESVDDNELLCNGPQPEDYVVYGQAKDRLLECLKSLKPKYRDVFVMRRFMDMDSPSIAAQLGISTRTVERYMETALKHCRQSLMEYL